MYQKRNKKENWKIFWSGWKWKLPIKSYGELIKKYLEIYRTKNLYYRKE